ncbi:MAG: HEAT repeat domain-containing protein [Planctomycetota bacterium]
MRTPALLAALVVGVAIVFSSCYSLRGGAAGEPAARFGALGTPEHADAVTTSVFCAGCHPAIYAEHRQNTHGRAFFDEEARLATRGFRREDCIRCHTPRPVYETGIGMTPMQRWTNLQEGNTCMSCHGRAGYDYSRFAGGAECRVAFDPEVGSVQDCATCHRIAGTPDQWSRAPHGKKGGNECMDCHMPMVTRPVAVGQPPRPVRSHLFPASSNERQLRKAYTYDARIEGNEVVVTVENSGVGHNFPTANRQRGVESLVIVRDQDGKEIARSRLVCRYPYASELQAHQMTPPKGSQIPSGKSTEHRVPIGAAVGTVECRLYFKLYRPSADTDPHLARCLESRQLPFAGLTPSTKPVAAEMEVYHPGAPTTLADFFDPLGFANTPRPAGAPNPVVVPEGNDDAELDTLAGMLEAHLPEVRRQAKAKLVARFPASAKVLVAALTRWSNETFNGAMEVFLRIGTPAVPTLRAALDDDHLYVRCHAREVLAQLHLGQDREAVVAALHAALALPNPLDRRSAALALGLVGDDATTPARLTALLADGDWDVVHAAARSLAQLGVHAAVPAIAAALRRARWPETHRELARALATLGSAAGVQPLLDDLQDDDVLQREYAFETLFAITGVHCGYEPGAPEADRLKAWSRLQAWWTQSGGDARVHAPYEVDAVTRAATWDLVEVLGGGTDTRAGGDDAASEDELVAYGRRAVPALIEGLTFPSGFGDKRALVCKILGRIGSKEAAPFLAAALRDPVPAVTEWACWALETCGDGDTPAQLRTYPDLVGALVGDRGEGDGAPADRLQARAARCRLVLGDETARPELVGLLSSRNDDARRIAVGALRDRYGEDRGYEPDADEAARRAAAARWLAK